MTDWRASHWRMMNDGLAKLTGTPTTANHLYQASNIHVLGCILITSLTSIRAGAAKVVMLAGKMTTMAAAPLSATFWYTAGVTSARRTSTH